MDLGIRGKVALVTASSKGLGRACAAVLAGEGVELVMTARGDAALRAAAGEIAERHGVRAHAVACDVSTEEGCARAVDAAREHFGRLDILVTNTGGPERADFGSATDAMWEVGFQSTMMNIVRLVRMAAPMMRERKWGRVVNIASVTARQPIKNLTISNALRPGIVGLAKDLSDELAPHGICVNTVLPGMHATDRLLHVAPPGEDADAFLKRLATGIPAGFVGEPMDLGAAVAFLCSAQARFISGATLTVDGGATRGLW
ncbi:MAG: SDR family oxidoreductase [Phycisphaerales bacterium]|nr:SDR family oxidoreductase [Phycisphaerales bacterium]